MIAAKKIAFFLLVFFICVMALFPVYWAFVTSLKTGQALFETNLVPSSPSWIHYQELASDALFTTAIMNSVIVATGVVILSLILSATASFALARYSFRGRQLLLFAILGISTFPQVAILSGLFELMRWLHLYNSLYGLILSYLTFSLPFTIWMLTSFMKELPRELEEAAIMDGATPWIILTKIFLPLLAPAFVTTGLLAFIAAWNEFLYALTLTLTNSQRTVPVAIAMINGATQHELPWGKIMAASLIVTVPLLLLVLFFQRRIIAGLTQGALKG